MIVLATRIELEILRDAVALGYREHGRETSVSILTALIDRKIGVRAEDEILPALKRLFDDGHVEDFQKWNAAKQWFDLYSEYVAAYGRRADTEFFYGGGNFNIIPTPKGRLYLQELEAAVAPAPPQVVARAVQRRRIGF